MSASEISSPYSIVIPVYNSGNNISKYAASLFGTLNAEAQSFEIIFVDDGSADDSWNQLQEIKKLYPLLDITILRLQKNRGQLAATNCGIDAAKYDIIVTIDDDGKYNAAEIHRIVEFFTTNRYILVFGVFKNRRSDFIKAFFYLIVQQVLFPKFASIAFSSFRVFSKSAIQQKFGKSSYGGNLHTLWLFKPTQIGNFTLADSNNPGAITRYNIFSLVKHQRYLVAYLLSITFRVIAAVLAACAIFGWLSNFKAQPLCLCLCAFISFIFALLASVLLKNWVKSSFRYTITERE